MPKLNETWIVANNRPRSVLGTTRNQPVPCPLDPLEGSSRMFQPDVEQVRREYVQAPVWLSTPDFLVHSAEEARRIHSWHQAAPGRPIPPPNQWWNAPRVGAPTIPPIRLEKSTSPVYSVPWTPPTTPPTTLPPSSKDLGRRLKGALAFSKLTEEVQLFLMNEDFLTYWPLAVPPTPFVHSRGLSVQTGYQPGRATALLFPHDARLANVGKNETLGAWDILVHTTVSIELNITLNAGDSVFVSLIGNNKIDPIRTFLPCVDNTPGNIKDPHHHVTEGHDTVFELNAGKGRTTHYFGTPIGCATWGTLLQEATNMFPITFHCTTQRTANKWHRAMNLLFRIQCGGHNVAISLPIRILTRFAKQHCVEVPTKVTTPSIPMEETNVPLVETSKAVQLLTEAETRARISGLVLQTVTQELNECSLADLEVMQWAIKLKEPLLAQYEGLKESVETDIKLEMEEIDVVEDDEEDYYELVMDEEEVLVSK